MMADYRLYILSADNHIRRAIEISAEDDAEAIDLARDHLDGEAAELWNLGRKVRLFQGEGRSPSGSGGALDEGVPL
jgi:hypothetical protein